MIYNIDTDRKSVVKYLAQQNFEKVIDIGGGMYSWAEPFVTHIADSHYEGDKQFICVDLNELTPDPCSDSFMNGGFDFAICTHTIEDLRDPCNVLKYLPIIAKEGFIVTPSKYTELCKRIENYDPVTQELLGLRGEYRGFIHHRWICSIIDEVLVLFPKLPVLEQVDFLDWAMPEATNGKSELSFWWKDDLPFKFFMDDFLAPNPKAILDEFKELIVKGI